MRVIFKAWGGQLVTGYVIQERLGFVLLLYTANVSFGTCDPSWKERRVKWYPKWRVLNEDPKGETDCGGAA